MIAPQNKSFSTVNLGVKIGENVRIGNGATVKSDVPAGSTCPLR